MADIETKSVGPLEIKDAEKGEVEAVVGTIGQVDHDGDVFLPGSISQDKPIQLSGYGHDVVRGGAAPVGNGHVHEENGRLVLRGRFFMSTARGREAFYTAKELGSDCEWSVGFPNASVKTERLTDEWRTKGARRLIAGVKLIEVSPVLQGAQPGTATLAVKEAVKEGVKEAVTEVNEETEQAKAEAAKKAEEEAAQLEAERLEAERKEAEAAEAKRLEEEAQLKTLKDEAIEEYQRVQRTLKRLGVIG